MLRIVFSAFRYTRNVSNLGLSNLGQPACSTYITKLPEKISPSHNFSTLGAGKICFPQVCTPLTKIILSNPMLLPVAATQHRTVTKFSLNKGKRKSVKAVIKRFKRLHWGNWIRTKSGRNKKMWKKSKALQRRLRQHVLLNSTQSWLLDKMVTKYWRRPKYYVDDPYEPYHTREEFPNTRRKPVDY